MEMQMQNLGAGNGEKEAEMSERTATELETRKHVARFHAMYPKARILTQYSLLHTLGLDGVMADSVVLDKMANEGLLKAENGPLNHTDFAFVDDAPATEDDCEAQVVTEEGETVADLRAAFESVQNEKHWKNPISAAVEASKVGLVTRAVTFFHADVPAVVGMEARTGKLILEGNGYSA